MDEKNSNLTSFAVESAIATCERTIKRLWVLTIILIIALIGTNAGWIWYESQFIETEVSQEVDTGEGDATVIGIGDYNGESKTDNQN